MNTVIGLAARGNLIKAVEERGIKAMGDLFQNLSAHPFAKLNHSLLLAGGTKVSALAQKCEKIFMAALSTSDPTPAQHRQCAQTGDET